MKYLVSPPYNQLILPSWSSNESVIAPSHYKSVCTLPPMAATAHIISIFSSNHHNSMIIRQFAASTILFIFFKRVRNSIMRWDWSHELEVGFKVTEMWSRLQLSIFLILKYYLRIFLLKKCRILIRLSCEELCISDKI